MLLKRRQLEKEKRRQLEKEKRKEENDLHVIYLLST